MNRFLQCIAGKRGIGYGEWEWSHQFHGSLFPTLAGTSVGKYGSFSFLGNRSPMRRFPMQRAFAYFSKHIKGVIFIYNL